MRMRARAWAVPSLIALAAGAAFGASTAAAQRGGTLVPQATNNQASFVAVLTGDKEVPPVATTATGTARVTVNGSTGEVCVNTTTSLSEPITASHIHSGAAGVAGPVVIDFVVTSGTSYAKCVTTTPAQAAAVIADPTSFYVNAHTATNPTGEIRGQLSPRGTAVGSLNLLPEPLRAYDSRGGVPLAANGSIVVDLSTGSTSGGTAMTAVPIGAQAALITITVTQTADGGYLTAFSNALSGPPATSTVNWTASNQDVAATTTVAVDGAGRIQVAAGPRGTHFIVDVIGYYL